ncbi:MAG: hypothetical protein HQ564_04505 [Candidatus Saganbacteria bacterium]|nr:hypothetical protein [Candidatus Saganbacteria bacterium]
MTNIINSTQGDKHISDEKREDVRPAYIKRADETITKAKELINADTLSFDKSEKLQAAIDTLDDALEFDTKNEYLVAKHARDLRQEIKIAQGKKAIVAKKEKTSSESIELSVKLIERYKEVSSKKGSNIPKEVQGKMAALKAVAIDEGEAALVSATKDYIDSVKLAKGWQGASDSAIEKEYSSLKDLIAGPQSGKATSIGSLAQRIVGPKEVSTEFSNKKTYAEKPLETIISRIKFGVSVVPQLTRNEKMQKIQDVVKEALTQGPLYNYLQGKIGDKITGVITIELNVDRNGTILVNPDLTKTKGIYAEEPDANKIRLAAVKTKLAIELEHTLRQKIKIDPPKNGKAYSIKMDITLV